MKFKILTDSFCAIFFLLLEILEEKQKKGKMWRRENKQTGRFIALASTVDTQIHCRRTQRQRYRLLLYYLFLQLLFIICHSWVVLWILFYIISASICIPFECIRSWFFLLRARCHFFLPSFFSTYAQTARKSARQIQQTMGHHIDRESKREILFW